MPREKGDWSSKTYAATSDTVRTVGGGRATYEGERRAQEGKGLDRLVDPKSFDGGRESNNLLLPQADGKFLLQFGTAMPVKSDLDTTGSMGNNVDIAFRVLPKKLGLFVQGPNAVLKRYHVQIATGVVQDRDDQFPYQVTQFEPDNEIDRQMGLLVPNRAGGDSTEDYQLALYYTGYRTKTAISKYGLRGYNFIAGDQIGRDILGRTVTRRVLGGQVELPKGFETVQLGKKLLENWHAFYLQVFDTDYVTSWWRQVLGQDRVVILPRTEDLAEVEAVIVGLTEGVLDLKTSVDFLTESGVGKTDAKKIVEAVAGIPLKAQANLKNFDKIPMAGAIFASRDDIWPISGSVSKAGPKTGKSKTDKKKKKESEEDWTL
ncbi:MAG TPA: hypothetical protein VI978_01940 [Candidatus Paceibacterota bacterium]